MTKTITLKPINKEEFDTILDFAKNEKLVYIENKALVRYENKFKDYLTIEEFSNETTKFLKNLEWKK